MSLMHHKEYIEEFMVNFRSYDLHGASENYLFHTFE